MCKLIKIHLTIHITTWMIKNHYIIQFEGSVGKPKDPYIFLIVSVCLSAHSIPSHGYGDEPLCWMVYSSFSP